jgi:hypothetical protein
MTMLPTIPANLFDPLTAARPAHRAGERLPQST